MILHNRPTFSMEEAEAATRVIQSGYLAQGREVEAFENELCEYLGYDDGHAVAVSSGTAALYMAIRAEQSRQDIRSIAIPAYSCSALRNAVKLAGLALAYADVEVDSPNIYLHSDAVTNSDSVIAAHMYGIPLFIDNRIAIEDCAQSIGAEVNGKKVGTQTDISVFSFYATKPITSGGEGGMVVSKDKTVISYIKDLRDFDMKNDDVIRFNLQMTDLQAAIGRVQLRKLDSLISRRRYLADRYTRNGIPLWNRSEGSIDYRGIIHSNNPQKLITHLERYQIRAIIPIKEKELLCNKKCVPNAYKLTQTLVSIPLYPSLTDEEQNYIIGTILEYANKEGRL